MKDTGLTLLTIPISAFDEFSDNQLSELLSYSSPDIVLTEANHHLSQITRLHDIPHVIALETLLKSSDGIYLASSSGIQLACVGSKYDLQSIQDLENNGEIDTTDRTYIFSSELEVNIDLVDLNATLEGYQEYKENLNPEALSGEYTHITSQSPIGYRNRWDDDFIVHGGMPSPNDNEVAEVSVGELTLTKKGVAESKTLRHDMFGLQAINQIGPKKSKTLRQAGLTTAEQVANSSIRKLSKLDKIGNKTGEKILYSARSLHQGKIYCKTKSGLPNESYDPIYIDIETDGLSPTMIWLIGVYDSSTENYMPFISTDPNEKGKAISAFMSWFSANAANRPVIAYNGLNFDYPAIYDHINQYCERHIPTWENAWKFDPLWWGPRCSNAIFPGRTNTLETVADELGYERAHTGLSGKMVGEMFSRWMKEQNTETELDWKEHKKYCREDVLSTKHIYEAIHQAPIIGDSPNNSKPSQSIKNKTSEAIADKNNEKSVDNSETTQGKLDNF